MDAEDLGGWPPFKVQGLRRMVKTFKSVPSAFPGSLSVWFKGQSSGYKVKNLTSDIGSFFERVSAPSVSDSHEMKS